MPPATYNKVCTDILKNELTSEITSQKQAYKIIGLLATCFVSVAEDQTVIAREIYGNGEPGGLKLEVMKVNERLSDIHEYIEEEKASKQVQQQSSSFDRFVKWAVDKVLPPLVVSAILAGFQVVFVVSAIMFAVANGWVSIQ